MQLSRSRTIVAASFDDPNLVLAAGMVAGADSIDDMTHRRVETKVGA